MERPDIYQYDDFRVYLKDCFAAKRKANGRYSQRQFARDAGFTNPGYFNDVLKGRRKLSKDAKKKMISTFELNSKEAEFFELLITYGQSRKDVERETNYQKILFRRSRSSFTRLNPSLVRYYQDYRYPLVRACIEVKKFKGDYESFSKFFIPQIPAGNLKKIVRDLCEWGLVRQDDSGLYKVTDNFVEPPDTLSHLIRQLHRDWILQSKDALLLFGTDQRHISSILMGVSRDTKTLIQDKIESLRREIFTLIKSDEKPETLMQLNIQFFPRSNLEVKDA